MKREILFRGKHIHVLPQNEHLDGVWVEGYLAGPDYIAPKDSFDKLVDPDTVGQYVGMTDCNDRKIFEGDIVTADWGYQGVVEFDSFIYAMCECTVDEENIKVIGNIWDNPELLRKE